MSADVAATPERLTALLRASGVLAGGDVTGVVVESERDTLVSHITRLRLTYGAGDGGPTHVFAKSQRDGVDAGLQELLRKEVAFYRTVAVDTPAGLLPRCYEAVAEPGEPWRLLLEDLTATHEPIGDWPLPPAMEVWHAVVAAHARFHAAWWDHPRLGVSVGTRVDAAARDRFVASLPVGFATFADHLGDRLSPERRRVYERLIEAAPRLLGRYGERRNLTLLHGDAHVWNAMIPRAPDGDGVRLVDWDAWRIDTATDDLAYMLAVHWFPDWRRRHERDSLQRYHDALVGHGVRGYSFETLWEDYRHSVLWQLVTPMWQANHKLGPWIWWNNLERIMNAVADLGCLELLD